MAVTGKDRETVYLLAVDYKQNQTIDEFMLFIGLFALLVGLIMNNMLLFAYATGALSTIVIKIYAEMAKEAKR